MAIGTPTIIIVLIIALIIFFAIQRRKEKMRQHYRNESRLEELENQNSRDKSEVCRTSTRFYVTQKDYDELLKFPRADLVIHCAPNDNNHPQGHYRIPNQTALEFIRSKMDTHNWNTHSNFKQDTMPTELRDHFTTR